MKVAIGCDHRGVEVKSWVAQTLESFDLSTIDCGTSSTESCDYPDIAAAVAHRVADQQADLGVLICGTGVGMSIAANKIVGIRAALCGDPQVSRLARQHNDANILCMAANAANQEAVTSMVTAFFQTEFEGGRHALRVAKINELDRTRP